MLVTRVMGRAEYENYLAGKTIRPKRKKLSEDTDARKHPALQNGAVFFLPVDIRKVIKAYRSFRIIDCPVGAAQAMWTLAMLASMTGLDLFEPYHVGEPVAVVFDVNPKRLILGNAWLHDIMGSFPEPEAYLPYYNKKMARMVYVEENIWSILDHANEARIDLKEAEELREMHWM